MEQEFILHIETATPVCSIAISSMGKVIEEFVADVEMSHASELMPLIDDAFKKQNISKDSLIAVSVSSGPGSYTGLRIGVSTAKGICYALGIPLIAVGSLHSAAWGMKEFLNANNNELLIPMIDARRMEVFAAIYDNSLNEIKAPHPWIIDQDSLAEFADKTIIIGGTGAEKLKPLYSSFKNIVFVEGNVHKASFAAGIAYNKFVNSDFADTAYFEPDYGKDFVPGKPTIKGLK